MAGEQLNRDRWRRYWDKASASYDKQMRFYDRLLADSRPWVCAQATGDTLEVAVGTGLNLPFYPAEVELTGVDLSPAMLGIAQTRARQLGRVVDLHEADAQALPFPDASFDTVVCTFSLCAIPDERRAVSEMTRVLRPAGCCCWPITSPEPPGRSAPSSGWPTSSRFRCKESTTCAAPCARSRPKGSRSSGVSVSSSGSSNGSRRANQPTDDRK